MRFFFFPFGKCNDSEVTFVSFLIQRVYAFRGFKVLYVTEVSESSRSMVRK